MPKLTLPNVSSKYGAPMGRRSTHNDPETKAKLHLIRLRWVSGDYDQGGAYWGNSGGTSIYWAVGEEESGEEISQFVRARNRDDAKAKVHEALPLVSFYR